MAEALALARALDQARDVGDDEPVAVAARDAEVRRERGERVVRDLRLRRGQPRQQRGLAGVRAARRGRRRRPCGARRAGASPRRPRPARPCAGRRLRALASARVPPTAAASLGDDRARPLARPGRRSARRRRRRRCRRAPGAPGPCPWRRRAWPLARPRRSAAPLVRMVREPRQVVDAAIDLERRPSPRARRCHRRDRRAACTARCASTPSRCRPGRPARTRALRPRTPWRPA